ncbi:MAG: hypothetical protein E7204_01370 [Veillonella sp.]|uniref:hypothetical protein n=1 Tax=Veillonella sp. TaxID=1926307 RepID=UPI0025DE3652|nr:hypothetical protein [Veillonella sp.]MBE6079493.1 hypothetical protein [Veillonella sp.]
MKKIFVTLTGLLLIGSSTVFADLQTQVIRHPDGSATINQRDPDDGYSYSEDVPPDREIIIPRKKIIMTPEEANELRDSYVNDVVRRWQNQNVIINVEPAKDEQSQEKDKK